MSETASPEFTLDLDLVDAGPAATGYVSATDDNCGSGNTSGTACTTKCDGGY
jgi:FxLD family lantipeptide